jgi:hypothetical protein
LSTHFSPKTNPIVERRDFYKRDRVDGERVAAYLAQLRALADKCEFDDFLTTALRDRLVTGINDERMMRSLLQEPFKDLSLDRAFEICTAMETAVKFTDHLQASTSLSTQQTVNALTAGRKHPGRRPNNNNDTKQVNQPQSGRGMCLRCGSNFHLSDNCLHKSSECCGCGKMGHLKKVCFKSKKDAVERGTRWSPAHNRTDKSVHTVAEDNDDTYDYDESVFFINQQGEEYVPPVIHTVFINNKACEFEIDSGSGVSIISNAVFDKLFGAHTKLMSADKKLHRPTYAGHSLHVLGKVMVTAHYNKERHRLPLYVVAGHGPNLLGRYWMKLLGIWIPRIHAIDERPAGLQQLLRQHAALFEPGLGKFTGPKVHLQVNRKVEPVFCKLRPVPHALRERVDNKINRLMQLGVFRPITHSAWAAPLVPIMKADKQTVRLCGDYKVTLNKAIITDQYTMPQAEDIFARLADGKIFSKVDMSEAYAQLVLDEESAMLAAVNTSKGLMAVTRLPYGVSSARRHFSVTWTIYYATY